MSVFAISGSPFWQFDFVLSGKRYSGSTKIRIAGAKGEKTKTAAKKFERERMAEAEAGTYIKRGSGSQPLKEFIAKRLLPAIEVERAEKPRTIDFYKSTYAKISEDVIGDIALNAISKAEITDFKVRAKKNGFAVATINRRLACLRKALRRAVDEELIPKAPKIEMLSGEHKREYVLLGPEREIFVAGMPEPLRNPTEFAFETGLRATELCTLTKDRVFFDGPFPHIRIHRKISKSKRERFVPLNRRAQVIILEEMERSRGEYVFVRWGKGVKGNRGGVTKPENKLEAAYRLPINRHVISHAFTARRKEMGLPDDVVFHTTRHSAATEIGKAGIDVLTLMDVYGWETVGLARRYVHAQLETSARAVLKAEQLRTITLELPEQVGK